MGVRAMERFLEQWQMEVKDLRRRMILAPTPRERERWYAILLLAQGWTSSATAQALERNPHTIRPLRQAQEGVGLRGGRSRSLDLRADRGFPDRGMYFILRLTQLIVRTDNRLGVLRYKIAPKCLLSGPFGHSGVGGNPSVAGTVRSYNLVLYTPVSRGFPPALGETQQAELRAAVQEPPAMSGIGLANWALRQAQEEVGAAVSLGTMQC